MYEEPSCRNCVFADVDRKVIELGSRNICVIGCSKGGNIEKDICQLHVRRTVESQKRFYKHVGDEICHIKNGTLAIITEINDIGDFTCITENGEKKETRMEDGKLWEKTGRNFKSIVGIYKNLAAGVSDLR